jgi:hypothetical protein
MPDVTRRDIARVMGVPLSVLGPGVEEEEALLEDLDFPIPCLFDDDGSHPAHFAALCRKCADGVFICGPHLAMVRRRWNETLRFARFFNPDEKLELSCCGAQGDSFDELIRLEPLP